MMVVVWHAIIFLLIAAIEGNTEASNSNDIGVCYGMLGNDLPSATDVINLYKKYGIGKIRLFDPNTAALNALKGSQIDFTSGVRNADLPNLAASQDAANSWFATNMELYLKDVVCSLIAVGNEVIPGEFSQYVLPVMQNLNNILKTNGLAGIRVSTVLSGATLASSCPPSAGAFTAEASSILSEVVQFLLQQGSPLLINVYPYFVYALESGNIHLDYAQFTATEAVVTDGNLNYYNLFDAMVDAFFSAMEKGVCDVDVVVSETGWPSDGNGNFTTPNLAATYNQNLMNHVMSNKGTPKRPNAYKEAFIFAMFNENLKPAGVEQHFGLFYPNKQPVYPLFTNSQ